MVRQCALVLVLAIIVLAGVGLAACGQTDSATGPAASSSIVFETPEVVTPELERTPTSTGPRRQVRPAPELTGTGEWINSEPFTIESQRGSVVLVDFWTYTCVNCIRTFPSLKAWHERYAESGLVILGVHSPEFLFEQDISNVRRAVADNDLRWPIVQDNEHATWDAFGVRFWPSKYLVDKNGIIQHKFFGEGGYDETEYWIRTLLEDAGADLSNVEPVSTLAMEFDVASLQPPEFDASAELSGTAASSVSDRDNPEFDAAFRSTFRAQVTDELYTGYTRCGKKSFSNSAIRDPLHCESQDQVALYSDPDEHSDHSLYLQGAWLAEVEALRHARETSDFEDYALLRFSAKSVNVVLKPDTGRTVRVLVKLDGRFLDASNKGEDVMVEDDGRSFLIVDAPRLYKVVEASEYGTYDLTLSYNTTDLSIFDYTFGIYVKGP